MNYRHAFHAGNFADCMKHALLLLLLSLMQRKPGALFVLDTHAGRGAYDLLAEASRTAEWHDGIARLIADTPPALQPYVSAAERLGLYPGSPLFIRDALRPDDAMACCELHPEDAAALRRRFRGDRQIAIHGRDGYTALPALLPPVQRRALVLIDPPFEQPDEFGRVSDALHIVAARMPGAVVAAWYPIKHRGPVNAAHLALRQSALRDTIAAELWLREPTDPARLNGCGLLIRNPPWGFEAAAAPILSALAERLGDPDAGSAILRLADE